MTDIPCVECGMVGSPSGGPHYTSCKYHGQCIACGSPEGHEHHPSCTDPRRSGPTPTPTPAPNVDPDPAESATGPVDGIELPETVDDALDLVSVTFMAFAKQYQNMGKQMMEMSRGVTLLRIERLRYQDAMTWLEQNEPMGVKIVARAMAGAETIARARLEKEKAELQARTPQVQILKGQEARDFLKAQKGGRR